MAKLSTDAIEIETLRETIPIEHRAALDVIAATYGSDTDTIINGLMDMTVRAAILGGVSAENFADGMKRHWDTYAKLINRAAN